MSPNSGHVFYCRRGAGAGSSLLAPRVQAAEFLTEKGLHGPPPDLLIPREQPVFGGETDRTQVEPVDLLIVRQGLVRGGQCGMRLVGVYGAGDDRDEVLAV